MIQQPLTQNHVDDIWELLQENLQENKNMEFFGMTEYAAREHEKFVDTVVKSCLSTQKAFLLSLPKDQFESLETWLDESKNLIDEITKENTNERT